MRDKLYLVFEDRIFFGHYANLERAQEWVEEQLVIYDKGNDGENVLFDSGWLRERHINNVEYHRVIVQNEYHYGLDSTAYRIVEIDVNAAMDDVQDDEEAYSK